MSNGLLLGRFMPLHAGHVALIRTAKALVDHLTIVICWQPEDVPQSVVRLRWLLEMFPSCRVLGMEAPSPRVGEAEWWRDQLRSLHPDPVDALFASDRSHGRIADAIGARFMLIDPEHHAVSARSADLRADMRGQWHLIPPAVRPAYTRTICLHGPESTGKSTLAARLARHYRTLFVPEYGRTYCEQFGRALVMDDLLAIAKTHAASTQALLRESNGRLFLDTDPLMTAAWATMLLGSQDPWFAAFEAPADLYLLLDVDVPFVDDGMRFFGEAEQRARFFQLSRDELDRRGLDYVVIGGSFEDRFERAVAAIDARER
jgi:HTH-type transcriptional regulator, transcriptional repressor of NAD biosynthesis genes